MRTAALVRRDLGRAVRALPQLMSASISIENEPMFQYQDFGFAYCMVHTGSSPSEYELPTHGEPQICK